MQDPIRFALVAMLLAAVPAHSVSQEPVELRWRGKVGDVMRYRMTQKQNVEMSMMPQGTESDSAFVFRQQVKELSSEGIGSLDVAYEALRMDVDGQQSMSYDSTRKGEETAKNDPDLAGVLEPILGAAIHMKIDPENHVTEITGLKEAMDAAFDHMKTPAMCEMFKQMFSEDNLRRMVETNTFPEKALATGDTWDRTMEVEAPPLGTMKFTLKNEFLGVEKHGDQDCVKIGVTGEVAVEEGDEESGMHFSMDDSDISGTMFFTLERGYLVESSLSTSLDLGMSIGKQEEEEEAEEEDEDGMELQITLTTEQHVLRIGEDDPYFE
jgi:hypothetical protein